MRTEAKRGVSIQYLIAILEVFEVYRYGNHVAMCGVKRYTGQGGA